MHTHTYAQRATSYLPGLLRNPTTDKPGSFLKSVLDAIRVDAGLAPEAIFSVAAPPPNSMRARPLYLSTAAQIGLIPTPGIPALVDALVPGRILPLVPCAMDPICNESH